MKKIHIFLLLAVVGIFVLSSCSGLFATEKEKAAASCYDALKVIGRENEFGSITSMPEDELPLICQKLILLDSKVEIEAKIEEGKAQLEKVEGDISEIDKKIEAENKAIAVAAKTATAQSWTPTPPPTLTPVFTLTPTPTPTP
ncbi:MAG: hypothetical protein COU63_02165 [Candidatus Pacebacteria bacterium CG10_big_fil_rev_8_21_14_0_10_36_11]|nr:MAG: hypothetical protein AUK08_03545 [Candidatus Pacebacteria bacterium CG2_30_36_39]PIR64799.1 MAG: hypothetical protein COU63_02165 [Candidatus Pacebacteria bacterium CG10_big_fil_rev_8_21_14_0_10_36_11]PJC43102.1 MAG: hypothetical protein CO040_00930 [Candidatus Pacebacteria bacterium CG_4_9_14_0_2_um_filter_36_8]